MVNCPNFVEEILVDILLRLPVKSIVRFKAVHSSWLSFLSSKDFTLQHLRPTEDGNLVVEEFKGDVYSYVEVYGSFNGLLLVSIRDDLILWNPSTMEYKRIDAYLHRIIGLGYDELNDSYKIILIHDCHDRITIDVYNLKTDSWKKIDYDYDEFPYIIRVGECTTLANGIPHWIAMRRGIRTERVVLCFDMMDEVLKEVPLPEEVQYISGGFQRLSVLDGDLCLATSEEWHVKLWVMKEYGTAKSWYKLNIDYSDQYHQFYFMPVGFADDNNQVVVGIYDIAIYNRSSNKFRDFVRLKSDVASYVETLVSPNNYYN